MIGQAERLYEINSLVNPKSDLNEGAKIISLTSGKGGTGKSFIACNIASYLASKGVKVLLIDLDINLANQNVLFNISAKKTLYHYMTFNQSIDDVIISYSENLDLILGESGKLDHPRLSEEKVGLLVTELKGLKANYDVILFDTSSGIENGTLQLLLKSDEIILVTSPEPTSVMDAYAIFKLLKSHGSQNNASVIVNKCFSDNDATEAFNNLEKATKHFLKTEINYLGGLSFSQEVIKSIQDQTPLMCSKKSNNISAQIKQISRKLRKATIG
jgi:flagellar biosynthesis protein FlhG